MNLPNRASGVPFVSWGFRNLTVIPPIGCSRSEGIGCALRNVLRRSAVASPVAPRPSVPRIEPRASE
jgi:hypothetical protein